MSITHVGPTKASFNNPGTGHSWSGRILSLAVSADGLRLYAGSYAGVWLSDDAGRSWSQLMKPQPLAHEEEVPGALYAGTVFDLVVSPVKDWDDPAKAQQIGPVLPPGVDIVQPSGGHASPVFYVADTTGGVLFKLDPSGTQWVKIVPGGPPNQMAQMAWRFFVNPFDPSLVYVLDSTAVKVSLDGGASWQIADSLTRAVTAGHRMTLDRATAFMDMVFVRSDPFTAFVFGHAGVSCTVDGVDWRLLLSAHAMPGCPEFGFFDGLSDPQNRALYVSVRGRSVLRIDPILRRVTTQGGANFTLLELSAVLGEA